MGSTDIIEAILSNARYMAEHKEETDTYLSQGELLEVCMDLSYLVKQVKNLSKEKNNERK